jgi:hypothetical protein
MKRTLFAVLVLSLAAGIAAAQEPVSCASPAGECIAASQLYGPTLCPAGFAPQLEACPVVAPTSPAADFEPKPIDVPGWVMTVVNFFSQKKTLPIPFAALLGAILIPLVGFARQIIVTFGAKLGPKMIFTITAVLGFLAAFANAASDGVIAGDEWSVVITGLAAAIAAFFGYRLIFSDAAKARYKLP